MILRSWERCRRFGLTENQSLPGTESLDRVALKTEQVRNRYLLQQVLRGELGFDGVLVSDYAGITEMRSHGTVADDLDAAVKALRDGTMTIDMEDGVYYAQLAKAVNQGLVRMADVDREVRRALAFKRRLGLFEKP